MSVIRFLGRLFWPFGRVSERRRERSKRKSTRKGTLPERGQRTARTTDGERNHMFELYEQGLGTHAIAKKTGRSTHTVHSVLTIRGTRPLPERNTEPIDEVPAGRTGGGGRRRRRGKVEDSGTADRPGDMSGTHMDKLVPKIIEACAQFIRSDPETLRQVVGSIMGVKIPRKTLDEMVMETIGDDSTLRREWGENRLQQMKRNGRSEMDIVEEGLDMLFKLNQELTKGAWPRVVNNAVVSGEARKTLVGLAGLWKAQSPTADEGQSGSTLGPDSPTREAIPPVVQQDQGPSPVNGGACGS